MVVSLRLVEGKVCPNCRLKPLRAGRLARGLLQTDRLHGLVSKISLAPVRRFSWLIRYAVDAPRSLRGRGADRVEGLGEAVVLLDADPNVVQVPITSAPLADVLPEITGLDGTPIPGPGDGRRPERDGRHSSQRQQADDFPFHGTSR